MYLFYGLFSFIRLFGQRNVQKHMLKLIVLRFDIVPLSGLVVLIYK